jgi:hypothetical protein
MKTTISTKGILSIIALIFGVIAGGSFLSAKATATPQAPPPKSANPKLNSDFLKAISKGDVKKINALAQAGAEINRPGTAVDIGDVQDDGGWFKYRFKSTYLVGAPVPMEQAILSAQPESVRALIALGADVKTEFFEDAGLGGVPAGASAVEGAFKNGYLMSLRTSTGTLSVSADGVVSSTTRPTPANKATFLSIVERWLAMPRSAKQRQRLEQIADLLREAMQR